MRGPGGHLMALIVVLELLVLEQVLGGMTAELAEVVQLVF